MEETAVADFVGGVRTPTGADALRARIVLSQRRLVLATDDDRITIPLSEVTGISVTEIDPELRTYLDDSVVVSYRTGGKRRSVAIGGDPEPIGRFQHLLFKTLLHGRSITIENPASVGGRVVRPGTQRPTVELESGELRFTDCRAPFAIERSAVIGLGERRWSLDGDPTTALTVTHVYGDAPVTTVVGGVDGRVRNLLRCYLGVDYRRLVGDLDDLDRRDEVVRALVWLYAGGGLPPSDVVPADALEAIVDRGLVTDEGAGVSLTHEGLAATHAFAGDVDL